LNPRPHGPESDESPSSRADSCGFQFDSSSRPARTVQIWMNPQPDYNTQSGPARWQLLRSRETEKHNHGATKPHHVLVAEAADSAGESFALDGRDLVNHDAALLAKTIRRCGLDCEPNQGSLCWVGRKRANRYGIRGVEAIILDYDDRPRLARVSGSASSRPDLAALQVST